MFSKIMTTLRKSPVGNFDNMNDDPTEQFVIRARGFAWSATAESVAKFFSGCNIRGGAKNGIHFTPSSEGHPSGECFVELVSQEDMEKALAKSKNSLGKSFVEVFKSTAGEMEQTCKRMGHPQDRGNEAVVRLSGLPLQVSKEEIAQFFTGLEIVPNGITITLDEDGRKTGDAFVEFASPELASQAMEKNKEFTVHRKIKNFKSSKADIENVSQPKLKPFMSTRPGPCDDGRYIEISKSSKADIRHVLKPKQPLMSTQPVPCDRPPGGFGGGLRRIGGVVAGDDGRKIKNFKSSKADIENVSQRKLKPFMSTRPGPYDRSPVGFGGRLRRIGGVVARDDGRSRFEFGDQYKVHTRKDLLCERSISAQTISRLAGTKFAAMLKNKQSMGRGDESETRFLGVFGGGRVPAKPTGDVVGIEKTYKMSRAPRGIAIIINNKNFLRSSGMDKRNGTDVDRDALEKLFKSLMFEVRIYNDVTADGIRRIAHEMASLNHSDYDAFIFSILTHGEEGLLYGTDGTISIRDLTSEFKDVTTLAGKPKMFFFQACLGNRFMDGMDVPDGSDSEASSKVSVPSEADFLYAYSTVPGYYSWRNSHKGSWFIQSLTKVFEENAERMDILRMLTRVNAMVSTFKSRTRRKDWDDKGQVSSTVSMLRKDLYFFPEKVTEQN